MIYNVPKGTKKPHDSRGSAILCTWNVFVFCQKQSKKFSRNIILNSGTKFELLKYRVLYKALVSS